MAEGEFKPEIINLIRWTCRSFRAACVKPDFNTCQGRPSFAIERDTQFCKERPEARAPTSMRKPQSPPGAKVRNPSKSAPEPSLRIVPNRFASPRRESSPPAPLPPPFSPRSNLSPRNFSVQNPQYLRASLRKAPDCCSGRRAGFCLSRHRILQSS